jgi:hypothetical protein
LCQNAGHVKLYLKPVFRVAFRANYYVIEDKVPLFYSHFWLSLNSFIQLHHPPSSPDLDMNDVGHFLKSNKPSESGIYKAEDIPKDML